MEDTSQSDDPMDLDMEILTQDPLYLERINIDGPVDDGIHPVQRNVARWLLNTSLEARIFPQPNLQFLKLNLLIIQPPSVALKIQTHDELAKLLESYQKNHLLNAIVGDNHVVNSPNLHKEIKFQDYLKKHEDYLHLLVLDEFDYGAKFGSLVNKYLREIISILQAHPRRHFLFLPISATPEMITSATGDFNKLIFSWREEGLRYPEHFGTPFYRSVYQLNYEKDDLIHKKCEERSVAVRDEYIAAIEGSKTRSIAFKVISDLRNTKGKGNHCALLRLDRIEHAKDVLEAYDAKYAKFKEDERPFSCINFDPMTSTPAKDMENTLIVVVDRLQRGEVLTQRCMHYDVRVRFTEAYQLSTMKQDIGRLAGHNKPLATVYNCFYSKAPTAEELENDCKKVHALLSSNARMLKDHPEFDRGDDNNVFTKLKAHLRILAAEPQIGKTGVIMGLIDLLHKVGYFKPPKTAVPSPLKPPPSRLSEMTKNIYLRGRAGLFEFMRNPANFAEYHGLMKNANQAWGDMKSPHRKIAMHISEKIVDRGEGTYCIADAGCGDASFSLFLEQRLSDKDLEVITEVYCLDALSDVDWHKLYKDNLTKREMFISKYYGGDFINFNGKNFDAVLFSLSLCTHDDITTEVSWAQQLLKNGGKLYLVDFKHRFTDEFKVLMASNGFNDIFCESIAIQDNEFLLWAFSKSTKWTKSHLTRPVELRTMYRNGK